MSAYEIGVIVVGALVGWWVVSWVFDKVRDINARPSVVGLPPIGAEWEREDSKALPMSEQVARDMLNVGLASTEEQVFDAYTKKARECDLILASSVATDEEKQTAKERREELSEAIRILQKSEQQRRK